jgi:cathepsin L
MKTVCILLALVGCAYSYVINQGPFGQIADEGWQIWKIAHEKKYADMGEERVRYVIWQDNLKRIEQHNSENGNSYSLRINKFGDMTGTEFAASLGLPKMHNRTGGSTFLAPSNVQMPTTVDWRDKGYVTPVKNQGQCGSCWAFSTTGSLEGQYFKKNGKLISLSEQQLVDCSTKFGNMGCNGGLMDQAFKYIKQYGIESEKDYPYHARDMKCKYDATKVVTKVTGFTDVTEGSEAELQSAVATVGPVSVAIDASHFSFQFYHEGVYNEPRCSSTQLDHGVLAVGYGTYQGKDYWLVKNSWGSGWGLKGYIRMSRNKKNQCGIASSASYPLL